MFSPVYNCTSLPPSPYILQRASTMSFLNKQYSSRISLIWFPLLHLCQNHACQSFQWLLTTNKIGLFACASVHHWSRFVYWFRAEHMRWRELSLLSTHFHSSAGKAQWTNTYVWLLTQFVGGKWVGKCFPGLSVTWLAGVINVWLNSFLCMICMFCLLVWATLRSSFGDRLFRDPAFVKPSDITHIFKCLLQSDQAAIP